jgi:hypothetical protein
MRPFRVRFTIRRIMTAVALVALLLGLGLMWARQAYCLKRAKWHSVQEDGFRSESDGFVWEAGLRRKTGDVAEAMELEAQSAEYRRASEEQARLKRAHEYVASHPWLAPPSED